MREGTADIRTHPFPFVCEIVPKGAKSHDAAPLADLIALCCASLRAIHSTGNFRSGPSESVGIRACPNTDAAGRNRRDLVRAILFDFPLVFGVGWTLSNRQIRLKVEICMNAVCKTEACEERNENKCQLFLKHEKLLFLSFVRRRTYGSRYSRPQSR